MISLHNTGLSCFCWVDLATSDLESASTFHAQVCGWRASERRANGGIFSLLQIAGENIGSMYQLDRAQRECGVPSHWTPYMRTDNIEEGVRRVTVAGGSVLVAPLLISNIARIALVLDPTGATIGLWQTAGKEGR